MIKGSKEELRQRIHAINPAVFVELVKKRKIKNTQYNAYQITYRRRVGGQWIDGTQTLFKSGQDHEIINHFNNMTLEGLTS